MFTPQTLVGGALLFDGPTSNMHSLFLSSLKDVLIDLREREREKHRSDASRTRPDWGSNLQPRHVP